MDPGIEVVRPNPKKSANFFSEMTFAWMFPFFRKGVKRGINVGDLCKPMNSDCSERIGNQLEANWEKQLKKAKMNGKEPSLVMALVDTFIWRYMVYGVLLFIQFVLLRNFTPLVLGSLIRLFSTGAESSASEMYITGAILVLASLITVFFQHHTNYGQQAIGMRLRISVSTLVYRKMLRLSKKSMGETAAGQVVNLLANDVSRFDFVTIALHFLWIAPFQIALVTYFLWAEVGIASLAGIGGMVFLTLPLQAVMARQTSKYRRKIAVRTDFRVRLMNEIISGIQVIKMYAWEKPFEILVKKSRIDEIGKIKVANYLRGVFLSSMVFIERTALYLTLITYVLTDHTITADMVYTMSQYFNLLQMAMAIFVPLAIQMGAETLVSLRRLQNFLELDEKVISNIEKTTDNGVSIEKVEASWTSEAATLSDVNLNIKPGQLCAIIGPVGAGKSSILQLILGELHMKSGVVRVGGDISYSSQEPWLFGSTVRGNILFGQEYKRSLYQKVVRVCALEKDFEQFPQGDNTMVGERGVSLSGGQRARINLARSVYRNANIYIMDDPLSAVDTHVGKHLFEECIMNYLGSKTRILVTHQLQFLKKADIIVVVNNGKIEAQGTFEELSRSDLDFTKMLIAADETTDDDDKPKVKRTISQRQESVVSVDSNSEKKEEEHAIGRNDEEVVIPTKSASTQYIKAVESFCLIGILGMVLLSSQVACSGIDYFVSYWTEQEEARTASNTTQSSNTLIYRFVGGIDSSVFIGYNYARSFFGTSSAQNDLPPFMRAADDGFFDTYVAIYIYSGLIIAIILLTIVRSYLFFKCASTASKNLHAKMFNCLLKTPMRFFDTNPSGRILNRFSKDIGAIDEMLPRVLSEAIQIMLVIAGVLVVISIANYWMIIVIAVLVVVFVVLRRWFLLTAKSIKHVEGIAKSPVFSHLNSTLNGISTIRASNAQELLIKEFDRHQDAHTSAWFLTISCMVSFGLWLDLICVFFIFCIVFSFILLNQSGNVSGAMVGLAISQSLTLTGMLQHGMRQTAEVVNQFTSVERILQYTKLDQEGPFDSPDDKKPPEEWPNDGKVTFKNLSLKYSVDEPAVLKNLYIDVLPGEKIGIVGRTGAGKSSLISALFRLAPLEGSINIDDLNTQSLGLHDVRKKISIIPQEPVLFSAPMRYNLDPFNEYDDLELWNALEEVELKDAISSLDFKVDEGGSNFSVGQRQLICLARAIVRNNKILVLDEATANVDPRTDGLIQATIRRKFKSCTVLTIAHRLNTIMDSDKVMVMDTGCMVEFDHPNHLLKNPEGHFTKMVMETGPSMTAALREVAKKAYEAKLEHAKLDGKIVINDNGVSKL